jgi:hypothetical protein
MPHIKRKLHAGGLGDVDTEYVLYTDADIMFLSDINSCSLPKPAIMSIGPEHEHGTKENTGVMYINVTGLSEALPGMLDYADSKQWDLAVFDQSLVLEHFPRGKLGLLPDDYNHKPYWGGSQKAAILHWHGPKPKRFLGCMVAHYIDREHLEQTKQKCPGTPDVYWSLLEMVEDGGVFYNRMLQEFEVHLIRADRIPTHVT